MKGDGKEIDEERLRTLLDFLIQNKVRGLVVVGSTGSIGSFDEDERRRIAEVAVEHVKDRVPIFVGTGSMKTEQAVRLSRHAEKIGADGVQVVAMAHWPLTEAELYGYYRDIASAVSIPILVHNVPALSGMDLKPPLLARLAQIENIRYLKEGSGDLSRITRLRRMTEGRIELWHDQDVTALQGLLSGADVWAPVVSALMPSQCVELFDLAVEKHKLEAARDLFERMFPLIDFISQKTAVRALHTAFDLMGEPVGPPRRPLRLLDRADRAELRTLLSDFGLLTHRAYRTPAKRHAPSAPERELTEKGRVSTRP
jgi:4-hydroxy-tetrahydrodipicolinate synthase